MQELIQANLSIMLTFIPCPPLGECVWNASLGRNSGKDRDIFEHGIDLPSQKNAVPERHILAQTLPNFVDGPPLHFGTFKRIGRQDLPCAFYDFLRALRAGILWQGAEIVSRVTDRD
jgi:hypothetical protein